MRILVACEFSGIVRDAFRARGHDAWSCDLLPSERSGPHLQDDIRSVLMPTNIVEGRNPRVHWCKPGKDRWKERSRTCTGIAEAMAQQWGVLDFGGVR